MKWEKVLLIITIVSFILLIGISLYNRDGKLSKFSLSQISLGSIFRYLGETTIVSSRIFSNTNDTGLDIQGFCNSTALDNYNVTYFYEWYKNGVINNSGNTGTSSGSAGWPETNLSNCRNITITNATTSVITNFVAYINITNTTGMNSDLSDIVFYNTSCGVSGSIISYVVESNSVAWIRIPSLATGNNAISMYYKNTSSISNRQNASDVWINYTSSYLMDDRNSTYIKNQVPLYGDGNKTNVNLPPEVNGDYGKQQNFSNNAFIVIGKNYQYDYDGNYTIETLVKINIFTTNGVIVTKGFGFVGFNFWLAVQPEKYIEWGCFGGGLTNVSGLSNNTWYHIIAKREGNVHTLYVNGVKNSMSYNCQRSYDFETIIGSFWFFDYSRNLDAQISYLSFYNGTRSESWINQSYRLSINQGSYVNISNEEIKASGQLPYVSGIEINVNNLSTSYLSNGDSWILGCMSQNKDSYNSSWLNSSNITIASAVYPIFSNYWDDSNDGINGTGKFNVTVENTNGTVLLEINGVNVSATNLTSNVYNTNYTFTNSGTYSYKWISFGNGTYHSLNVSPTRNYTISIPLGISIKNARAYSLNNLTNESVQGFCNATTNNGYNTNYYYRWFKNNVLITNGSSGFYNNMIGRGLYPSIVIDTNNIVHIVTYWTPKLGYYNITNGTNSSVANVDSDIVTSGTYSSLALDSNNKVHTASNDFYLDGTKDLRYCNNTGSAWSCIAVETGDVGQYNSIAIDTNNKVHISHYNFTSGDLRYCNKTGASWSCAIVDSTNDSGMYSSIAIDTSNKVHITTYDNTNGDLRYCNKTVSGTWTCTTIDSTGSVGKWSSLIVDKNNKVHISEYDEGNQDLKYCNNTNGTFVCITIDSNGDVGKSSSITMDSNNYTHIVAGLNDSGNYYLRYCNNLNGSFVCSNIEKVDANILLSYGGRMIANKKGRLVDSNSYSDNIYIGWYNASGLRYTRISLTNSTGKYLSGVETNVNNLSTSYLNETDTIILSCMGTVDGTNSSWLNSSGLYIKRTISIEAYSPSNYQFYQRFNDTTGEITINGTTVTTEGIDVIFKDNSIITLDSSTEYFYGKINYTVNSGDLILAYHTNHSINITIQIAIGDIFVITGQSNAGGYSLYYENLSSRLRELSTVYRNDGVNNSWYIANDPTVGAWGSNWPEFVNYISLNEHIPIGLIGTSVGATTSIQWIPNGTDCLGGISCYENMINMINSSTEGKMKVKGMVFYQGESDMYLNNYTNYQENINKMCADFIKVTGGKCFIGQVLAPSCIGGSTITQADVIKKAQQDLWGTPNVSLGAVTHDLSISDGMQCHYSAEAEMLELSKRWYYGVISSIYDNVNYYPYIQSSSYWDNGTNTFVNITYNTQMEISYFNRTLGTKAFGFTILDNSTEYNETNVTSTTLSDDNLTITLLINKLLVPITSNGYQVLNISYGKLMTTYFKTTIRSKSLGLPPLISWNDTLSYNITSYPQYSNNITSTPSVNSTIVHTLDWTDILNLSSYQFKWCNGTWDGTKCSNWANQSFSKCRNITIINATSSTITDALIYIKLGNISGIKRYDPDLVLYDTYCNNNGNKLSYVVFDSNLENLTLLVRIPTLTANKVISMYYGNLSLIYNQDRVGTYSNFTNVFLMNNYNTTLVEDYTNNNNMSKKNNSNNFVNNPIETTSEFGYVQSFNGNGELINYQNNTLFSDSYTIEALVYPISYQIVGVIIAKGLGTPIDYTYWLGAENGNKITWGCWISGAGTIGTYQSGLNNTWYYIVAKREGNNFTLYVNGNKTVGENKTQCANTSNNAPINIGGYYYGGAVPSYQGKIKYIAIYNNTRSEEWINQSYQMYFNQTNYITIGNEMNSTGWVISDLVNFTNNLNTSTNSKYIGSVNNVTYAWCFTGTNINGLTNSTGCVNPFTYDSSNSTGMCSPTLNTNWIIDNDQVCDGVDVSTGTGNITITSTGILILKNNANVTGRRIDITGTGQKIIIDFGSKLRSVFGI